MNNYFNSLSLREKLLQLGKCRFMDSSEFNEGVDFLLNKKIAIVGCGAQGLHQGLNMRDSGLDISYALRQTAIDSKRQSFINATSNNFKVGTFDEIIPDSDLVINLTPDKNHTPVVEQLMPLMKKDSILSYSHGFNIVEEGIKIREDITVIMVAPKSPGSEVREEYLRGFGVPTLIAVHPDNDKKNIGFNAAKAYAVSLGSDKAGVLESSFVAEVKSDLMGEQTILCGMLQTGSILCFNKMNELGVNPGFASKLIQHGWETITEALKHGGITNMMDRLNNPSKVKAFELSEELKSILKPLFVKHMDNILSGKFSEIMMKDWENDDKELLSWREETSQTEFEKSIPTNDIINEQDYFDFGILMVAFVKAGVELAYETMVESGIKEESAYYESLHELPLIANLVSRKKLYEMNSIISDTAEYGCYLFNNEAIPLLSDFFSKVDENVIGTNSFSLGSNSIDNKKLIEINESIRFHSIEIIGDELRQHMTSMKKAL
ncbi:MAG: ketol-acid reductoisomerase [Bacteroidota bacterium]